MPVYDYECPRCGPFTVMRPMAEYDRAAECPGCERESPRAFLTAPYFASMSAERRLALATNERSAHAPRLLSAADRRHGAGCGCCAQKPLRAGKSGKSGKNAAKGFPARRPWMLSH